MRDHLQSVIPIKPHSAYLSMFTARPCHTGVACLRPMPITVYRDLHRQAQGTHWVSLPGLSHPLVTGRQCLHRTALGINIPGALNLDLSGLGIEINQSCHPGGVAGGTLI